MRELERVQDCVTLVSNQKNSKCLYVAHFTSERDEEAFCNLALVPFSLQIIALVTFESLVEIPVETLMRDLSK